MTNNLINTDKYELYSFLIYLYFYAIFYRYVFEHSLFKGLIINIIGNIIFHKICNYNIFSLSVHKYWKHNLQTIAMPQLITCLVNTNIPNYDSYLIITPTYILSYYFINNMYKTEIKESRQLRFTITIIFFLYNLFF